MIEICVITCDMNSTLGSVVPLAMFLSLLCFFCFPLELFLATSCRIQPTRSAQQKNRTPPVQSAPPPKRLPPPEPEPKSPPKKSSPPPPLLPPLQQWLSHEDMEAIHTNVSSLTCCALTNYLKRMLSKPTPQGVLAS